MSQRKAAALISVALGSALVVKQHVISLSKPQEMENTVTKQEKSATATVQNCDEYTKPIFENGLFKNPWETWKQPGFFTFFKMRMITKNESNVPSGEELDKTLPIIKPDIRLFDQSPNSGVRVMWIGHATVVAQLDGFTVITDPVFGKHAGPLNRLVPKRYRDPPCSIEELPKLDAVVISHNHYDHLDLTTVVALNERFGKDLRWFVPLGLKKWMNERGCENVVEMSWWDEHEVEGSKGVRVACTPCQHWCRRGVRDENKALWSSWCVLGPHHSFHFSGDTGYCQVFQQIGHKYGPFTAAAIPIGAYHPRWFMSPQHVDPAQAVDIHTDIKSKHSIGIHWGTFVLSGEPYLEPRELLKSEVEKRQLSPATFVTLDHGAVTTLGADDF